MNDNYLLIPELTPTGWEFPNVKANREEARDINNALVTNLGYFSLQCARAAGIARDNGKYEQALDLLEEIHSNARETAIYSSAYTEVFLAFYMNVLDWMLKSKPSELDLQDYIKKNLAVFVTGECVPVRSKQGAGLCDLLIKGVDGHERPMEVKLGCFDNKAKRQLRRYMDFYKSPQGYACASKLKCSLDPDMIFVPSGDEWRHHRRG